MEIPKISSAEWEVLNVLWDGAPMSSPQIFRKLAKGSGSRWHAKTVGTFLTRLEQKGVLEVRREGRVNFYTPRFSREACVRQESETFLQRVFRGATAPLLAHFCEHAELSETEVAELRRLLEQRKGGR